MSDDRNTDFSDVTEVGHYSKRRNIQVDIAEDSILDSRLEVCTQNTFATPQCSEIYKATCRQIDV